MVDNRPGATARIIRWIDYRLPFVQFLNHELNEYPTPRNLSYWWNYGSLSGIMLVVMIVSGITPVEDRIRGLSVGADDYVPKPFEPEELALRVNAILRRTRERGRISRLADPASRMAAGDSPSALEDTRLRT